MGARLLMVCCTGTHDTPWFSRRGDELQVESRGVNTEMKLELVCQVGEEYHVVPLNEGLTPFPLLRAQRYRVCKRITQSGAQKVPTTVKIATR